MVPLTITKFYEGIPGHIMLKYEGEFLGYDLNYNYAEVFKYKNKKYVVLDEVDAKKKVVYHVHRWMGKTSNLVQYFNEIDGFPVS